MWSKIFLVAAVAGVGYYAYTAYTKKKAIASLGAPAADKKGKVMTTGGGALAGLPGLPNSSGFCGGCS